LSQEKDNYSPIKRVEILDALRGLAALGVCLYHFGRGLPDGILKQVCSHGNLGVDVFFVISGFVIPLWLDRTGGGLKQIPAFLLKRFVRLYPAYFAACTMILAFWWISSLVPGYRGKEFGIEGAAISANILFLCDIVKMPWVIPVSWSLAIEWQYYILVPFAYLMLKSQCALIRNTAVVLWIGMSFLPFERQWLTAYGSIFALGFLSYLRWKNCITFFSYTIMAVCAASVYGMRFGIAPATTAALGSVAILMPFGGFRWMKSLGQISYSLYLTHVFVGGRITNFGLRFEDNLLTRGSFLIASILSSILFAWFFFQWVEKPSHRGSQNIGN